SRSWARNRSWRFWTITFITAATLIYVGSLEARRAAYAGRLPGLPELSPQQRAIRAHLNEADRAARSHPTSADIVGALGVAYHADMFYGQAQRCYAIAEALSGFNWRWTYYRALALGGLGDADGLVVALHRV